MYFRSVSFILVWKCCTYLWLLSLCGRTKHYSSRTYIIAWILAVTLTEELIRNLNQKEGKRTTKNELNY